VIFYVLLTIHFDIIVYRKTNLIHNIFLVYLIKFYMFRAYLGPSSGCTKECIQQLKGKAIPLQAWTGPRGSRRLRLLNFKTIGT
jgi:hypothetical protein